MSKIVGVNKWLKHKREQYFRFIGEDDNLKKPLLLKDVQINAINILIRRIPFNN